MAEMFAPKFKNFQADIEAYLAAAGKREKARDGFVIFRGWSRPLHFLALLITCLMASITNSGSSFGM